MAVLKLLPNKAARIGDADSLNAQSGPDRCLLTLHPHIHVQGTFVAGRL